MYVDQATAAFTVNGKKYPAGSYVIKTNQAARAHVLDMMEPQDHPNDFAYPGGPPLRPYDNAGWTLAYEMGVQVRPHSRSRSTRRPSASKAWPSRRPASSRTAQGAAGYLMSHAENDAVTVMNRVFKDAEWRRVLAQVADDRRMARRIRPGRTSSPPPRCRRSTKSAADLGVSFVGVPTRPADAIKITAKRIALYDQYGGSMPSGWTRLTFENFEIPYQTSCIRRISTPATSRASSTC